MREKTRFIFKLGEVTGFEINNDDMYLIIPHRRPFFPQNDFLETGYQVYC